MAYFFATFLGCLFGYLSGCLVAAYFMRTSGADKPAVTFAPLPKPFSRSKKTKPKINSDEKVYLMEKDNN